MAKGNNFPHVDKHDSEFGFGAIGNDELDNLGGGDNGDIVPRHQVTLREEDVGSGTAAATSLVELAGIGVACKDHICCTVGDAVVWLCGNIVEELVDSVSGDLSGHGLLGANGSEIDKTLLSTARPYHKIATMITWTLLTVSTSSGGRE